MMYYADQACAAFHYRESQAPIKNATNLHENLPPRASISESEQAPRVYSLYLPFTASQIRTFGNRTLSAGWQSPGGGSSSSGGSTSRTPSPGPPPGCAAAGPGLGPAALAGDTPPAAGGVSGGGAAPPPAPASAAPSAPDPAMAAPRRGWLLAAGAASWTLTLLWRHPARATRSPLLTARRSGKCAA